MGGFRSVYLAHEGGANKIKLNDGVISVPPEHPGADQQNFTFSSSCDNATVKLTFKPQASFYSVIYGSRNDISDLNKKEEDRDAHIGDSNYNNVTIDLTAEGSLWRGTLIMGGRSAQAEDMKYANQKGYETNENSVKILGRHSDKDNSVSMQFVAGGLWGAEGWKANNNLVLLDKVVVQSQSEKTRKLGIVGGRGFFDYRIYDTSDQDQDYKNNTIANGNVVLIRDSIISDEVSMSGATDKVEGMAIFGGYSYGEAENNIVSISNSIINGNVIGALEMQGVYKLENGKNFRNLNSNLVSLHNVTVKDGAIYGTATSVAKLQNGSEDRVEEKSVQAVNRRRGIAYVAGTVKADSAYVRYIHFGQYYDEDYLEKHYTSEINLSKDYLRQDNEFHSLIAPNLKSEKTDGVVYTSKVAGSEESINLGQLVGGSYILNRRGFHSSLAHQDDSQSDFTDGMHNFWVATYSVVANQVDGNGKFIDYNHDKSNLFKANNTDVNHYYGTSGDEHLSLLVHDNGVTFDRSSANKTWTDAFRDEYKGLVLYLAVNNGQGVKAIDISRPAIEIFRKENEQQTHAYGNTQVFVAKWGDEAYTTKSPMGTLTTPSENFEDFVFTIDGFDVNQNGKTVAKATYGFYKYLHVDGKYSAEASVTVKHKNGSTDTVYGVTQTGKDEAGGVGIKYWLQSLDLISSTPLILYGKTNESGDVLEDNYTLSAELTGLGGILIPEGNTVIIGDNRNRYTNGVNSFSGTTTVQPEAVLIQKTDGALGNSSEEAFSSKVAAEKRGKYTSELNLEGTYQLSAIQSIGYLKSAEGSLLDLSKLVSSSGQLYVRNGALIEGNLKGDTGSLIKVVGNGAEVHSANPDFHGLFALDRARGYLENEYALQNATAEVSKNSALYFDTPSETNTRANTVGGNAYIGSIHNYGDVYLSRMAAEEKPETVNRINISGNYVGGDGSQLHYRGEVQGDDNSAIDVVRVEGNASGRSAVTINVFGHSRGEKTDKGILIFSAKTAAEDQNLVLTAKPRVVDKDDNAYEWIYDLEAKDNENGEEGGRNWYLVNERPTEINPTPDVPVVPDLPEVEPQLRPEAGAYAAASQSWARMHMRLHDRFGQAYYIDPFDGEEKPAAAWVRQVGSHSHFRMNGGESKTHSRTAVTQLGGDLIRNEFNEDWKYIGGVFTGGLYNRADSRSYAKAKSRSDGYAFGAYGTIYTGNSPDDGFYVDTWILYGRYDNKVWGDQRPTFKYKSHGWVWSVETGYTIPLGESGTKDFNKVIWTLQPEAQVIWDGVKANSATDSTGTRYKQLGTDNVVIRAGARLHANYMNKGLGFIEGNWIHNTKKAGVEMGNGRAYVDGGRNLGEFRMGLEGHLSRNTLGWATVGVQAGKSGYHNETAQIGIKYMF